MHFKTMRLTMICNRSKRIIFAKGGLRLLHKFLPQFANVTLIIFTGCSIKFMWYPSKRGVLRTLNLYNSKVMPKIWIKILICCKKSIINRYCRLLLVTYRRQPYDFKTRLLGKGRKALFPSIINPPPWRPNILSGTQLGVCLWYHL